MFGYTLIVLSTREHTMNISHYPLNRSHTNVNKSNIFSQLKIHIGDKPLKSDQCDRIVNNIVLLPITIQILLQVSVGLGGNDSYF